MRRYAALLRGVNVSGRNTVGMAELRARLVDLGYRDVTTYIQSGNVVFGAPTGGESALVAAIEAEIRRAFKLEVGVLIRSPAQLRRIGTTNPFLQRADDRSALHVTFLAETPPRAKGRELSARPAGPDDCVIIGREIYLRCPGGYGKTKLNNTYLERVLGTRATTRNWKTLLKLRELVEA